MASRHFGAVILVSFLLGGCLSAGPIKEPVDSFSAIGNGEAVLVGRIELVPPLSADEADPDASRVTLFVDNNWREIVGEPVLADFAGRIHVPWTRTFFVKAEAKTFYVLKGRSTAAMNRKDDYERVYFPGGFKIDIRAGDKAVYIGTIRYHRNEFFEITKTEIIDDFRRVKREFVKQFGTQYPLRRALTRKAAPR